MTIFLPHEGGVTVHQQGYMYITIRRDAILQGWIDARSGLWPFPLTKQIKNENTDTILLDIPLPNKAVCMVYDLPTTEATIRYLHVEDSFPTKET